MKRPCAEDLWGVMSSTPSPRGAPRYRPELHGLRGVAIGLVVVYHVWFDRVSGGVDVFLFISAFLLLGSFMRRIEQGEPARPFAYWARTFKRLLPPTAVVVLLSLLGVRLLLPPERWMPAISDAIGALLHVENWVLVQRGVDYYAAAESGPSVFQHFWSLSIQGQVFLLWPLLIAGGVFLARTVRRSPRVVLGVIFSVILLASLGWSVHSTATQQQVAYFDTFARLWEFAAGSLLGLLLPVWEGRQRSGRRRAQASRVTGPRVLVGWLGLAGLISCGLIVDVQGAFPGWIALWPLTAAAIVLAVGSTGHRLSADRLLASRPTRVLGDISYGLYLVHWPLLALYLAHTGRPRAGLLDGLVLVLVSLGLAWLLTRLVDTPVRRWPWAGAMAWRSGLVALTALAVGLAPVIGMQQHLLAEQRDAELRAVADNPGARVLDATFEIHPDADPAASALPTAAMIGKDWVSGGSDCSGVFAPSDGEADGLAGACHARPGPDTGPVLVSVGNSRIEQLSGAVITPALDRGWTVVTLWKGGCTFAPDASVSPECDAFSEAADRYLRRIQPDAVLLASTFLAPDGTETVTAGMEQTLPSLAATGSTVIAARDLPRLPVDPPACIAEQGAGHPSCTPRVPAALTAPRPDAGLVVGAGQNVIPLEVTDLVCPEGLCPPVIGNVVVSIDRNHLTATYAASMQDAVSTRLEDAGFSW